MHIKEIFAFRQIFKDLGTINSLLNLFHLSFFSFYIEISIKALYHLAHSSNFSAVIVLNVLYPCSIYSL